MSPEQDQLLMKGDPEIHVVEKEDPASSRRVLAKKAQKPNRRMKDVVAIAFVEEGELQQGESPPRRPTKRERMEDVGCHWPLRQLPKMPRSAALIEPDKFKNVAEKMLGKKKPPSQLLHRSIKSVAEWLRVVHVDTVQRGSEEPPGRCRDSRFGFVSNPPPAGESGGGGSGTTAARGGQWNGNGERRHRRRDDRSMNG